MIKKLLILPILLGLVSCTFDSVNAKKNELVETIYNVAYSFNYEYMKYVINVEDKVYKVEPENFYNIYVKEYKLIDPNASKYHEENQVVDELLVYETMNKLYVYKLL